MTAPDRISGDFGYRFAPMARRVSLRAQRGNGRAGGARPIAGLSLRRCTGTVRRSWHRSWSARGIDGRPLGALSPALGRQFVSCLASTALARREAASQAGDRRRRSATAPSLPHRARRRAVLRRGRYGHRDEKMILVRTPFRSDNPSAKSNRCVAGAHKSGPGQSMTHGAAAAAGGPTRRANVRWGK
jgi:hypothetical protein